LCLFSGCIEVEPSSLRFFEFGELPSICDLQVKYQPSSCLIVFATYFRAGIFSFEPGELETSLGIFLMSARRDALQLSSNDRHAALAYVMSKRVTARSEFLRASKLHD
jgi:hypothetical protein